MNVDLILGFLRNLVTGNYDGRGGINLKVVVMSATADIKRISSFFEEGFQSILGAVNVESFIEDVPALQEVTTYRIQGQLYSVELIYANESTADWL